MFIKQSSYNNNIFDDYYKIINYTIFRNFSYSNNMKGK